MKLKRIPTYRIIWGKIRYYQTIHEIEDTDLAKYLMVGIRTLKDYDKDAKNLTLEKVDNFLRLNNLEMNDLLSL